MQILKNNLNLILYALLAIFSFIFNFQIASYGVFPVDTFIHFDNGFRILLDEHPVKDYWIVHGFLIDYIQAIFFKVFGNNWYSYVFHSSFFNLCVSVFSFYIFNILKIRTIYAFLFSASISVLAYPVSGTPFLDLHSTYFSLFATYFTILAVIKNKNIFWYFTSIFLCCAFFSKQVPAAYTIIGISLANIFLSYKKRDIFIFVNYILGAASFLALLMLLLLINKIPLDDFLLQIFLFPQSIGSSRYGNYELGIKNIFLDFKFIYLIFFFILFVNLKKLFEKNYINSNHFYIFLLITIFLFTTIFHQVFTKNQIYIFFLIPLCSAFVIYYNQLLAINIKKKINLLVIVLCFFTTVKYHERFNLQRKFHELNSTDLSNYIEGSIIDKKFNGLKWTSPYFKDPKEESQLIISFLKILKNEKKNKMVISQYNFLSSLTEDRLFSPSRTYDAISYPKKNTKYYNHYKSHLVKIIKNKNIDNIFIFEPYSNFNINKKIFDYIPANCFSPKQINKHLLKLKIKKCDELL